MVLNRSVVTKILSQSLVRATIVIIHANSPSNALDQPIYTPDQNHSHLLPHPARQNCACAQYTTTTITQESGCQAIRQNPALIRACHEAEWVHLHAENSPKNTQPHGLRLAGLQGTHVDNTRRKKAADSAREGPEGVPNQHYCTVQPTEIAGGPAKACSCYIMREDAGSCSAHTPARVGFISARPMRALRPHQHQQSTHTHITHTHEGHTLLQSRQHYTSTQPHGSHPFLLKLSQPALKASAQFQHWTNQHSSLKRLPSLCC
jgi:hypothetical protein